MPKNKAVLKAYNIAHTSDNSAEINMYGEVVATRPIDWWTGEPLPGNYICQDEFLADLNQLAGKDFITVHINSVGGDAYAGIAIYNRLRELPAEVTTINDSLAASAGSIILQAGDKRIVKAASNTMIHNIQGFLYGYYTSAELKNSIKQLEAGNKTLCAVYCQAGDLEEEHVKSLLSKETWMVGQEAVDAGFADEVDTQDDDISMGISEDHRMMQVGNITMHATWMPRVLPRNMAIMPLDNKADEKKIGDETMQITNIEELRNAYPEFCAQIEKDAKSAAYQEERARIQSIENIQAAIGDKDLIHAAKFGETPQTAQELALAAMQLQAKLGTTVLNNMDADSKASGAEDVNAAPNSGTDDAEKTKVEEKAVIDMIVGQYKKED